MQFFYLLDFSFIKHCKLFATAWKNVLQVFNSHFELFLDISKLNAVARVKSSSGVNFFIFVFMKKLLTRCIYAKLKVGELWNKYKKIKIDI